MDLTDLSISVVSYNTKELLRRCLTSVFESTAGISLQVLVVDNASQDGSPEMVRTEFPWVTLIANQSNVGFATANNQALSRAKGRHFLLLNSDTKVLEDALTKMVQFMDETPDCGICCPQLYYPDGRIQTSYSRFHRPKDRSLLQTKLRLRRLMSAVGHPRGRVRSVPRDVPVAERPTPVERPRGACFMIRMACVEEIGPMDERFFMYCEEVDWALRAHRARWRAYIVPQAKVSHVWGASTSSRPSLMEDIHAQSDYYFYHKHFGLHGELLVRLGDMVGAGLGLLLSGGAVVWGRRNRESLSVREELSSSWRLVRRALSVRPIRPQD